MWSVHFAVDLALYYIEKKISRIVVAYLKKYSTREQNQNKPDYTETKTFFFSIQNTFSQKMDLKNKKNIDHF